MTPRKKVEESAEEIKLTKPARTKKVSDTLSDTEEKPKAKKAPKTAKSKVKAEKDGTTAETALEEGAAKPAKATKKAAGAKPKAKAKPKKKKEDGNMIAFIASECVPFAKTGGLADVVGTLPQELKHLGTDVCVFLPFHRVIKEKYRMEAEHVTFFYINLGWRTKFVGVEKLLYNGVTYYFIDNEDYFGGPIYMGQEPEGEQYAFFCRAVLEAMIRMELYPALFHLNDWQTAIIPLLIKTQYQSTPLCDAKSMLTIHNMMYQGQYSFDFVQSLLGIDSAYYTPEFMEANGSANFLKAGLVFSDMIGTVSPTYAQELKYKNFAYGLEGIMNARSHQTIGILNGIDTVDYNPETDPYLAGHYSPRDLSGKRACKEALIEEMRLDISPDTPIIGIVSRLTPQKGFDLIQCVFHEMMEQDVAIVLLGTGDRWYEDFFAGMEHEYKGRVCSYIGYNNEVAHHIYAGSDLFLMPSLFEPCGISQMIAQRYGTLPIVRETGGLKDTVLPFNEFTGEGTGFSFANYNAHDMLEVIKYALWCLNDEEKKNTLIQNAMACDNSFAASAQKYNEIYKEMLTEPDKEE